MNFGLRIAKMSLCVKIFILDSLEVSSFITILGCSCILLHHLKVEVLGKLIDAFMVFFFFLKHMYQIFYE